MTLSSVAAHDQTVASAPPPQTALVDIKRASIDDQKTPMGIGDFRAAEIVQGGSYMRKDDLLHRGVVPPSVYDGIREQIIAKQ